MDETTNPEPGVDSTPAPEADAYDDQPSDELADGEQSDEPAPVDEDAEEAEYDGKKFTGPKGIKEAILRQADYTRKTQEVAEQRKQVEAQAAQVQQFAQLTEAAVGYPKQNAQLRGCGRSVGNLRTCFLLKVNKQS